MSSTDSQRPREHPLPGEHLETRSCQISSENLIADFPKVALPMKRRELRVRLQVPSRNRRSIHPYSLFLIPRWSSQSAYSTKFVCKTLSLIYYTSGVKNGIPIPLTPDVKITAPLECLNECLRNWGHIDEDPTKFLKTFRAELAAVSADPDALAEFIKAKEIWVEAGDVLLDAMQYILGELIIDHLDGEVMRWLWTRVSSAAFKIQYRMTVVEVYLDGLDMDRDDSLEVQ